ARRGSYAGLRRGWRTRPCSRAAPAASGLELLQRLRDCLQILVAAPGKADQDDVVGVKLRRHLLDVGDGVRRLQRRDDALAAAEVLEGLEGLSVGDADVAGTFRSLEEAVLRSHAGVIQARADAVGLDDLPEGVLQQVGVGAMKHAGPAAAETGSVFAGLQAAARGFDADEAHGRIVDEIAEQADGVAAAANAGHGVVWQTSFALKKLLLGLAADDALEVAHHGRVGVRAHGAADEVVGGLYVGDPVAHGLIDGVLE